MNSIVLRICPILLFSLLSGLACTVENPAEMIIYNAKIVCVDAQSSQAEALAIKGDKILAVGTNKEIMKLADGHSRMIDAAGKTVVPGIIDAHLHPEMAAYRHIR